jgi:hypothetical protein
MIGLDSVSSGGGCMRETRQTFFSHFATAPAVYPNRIFSERSDKKPNGSRVDTITVIMRFHWPSEKGKPLPATLALDDPRMASILAAIFRVKDFLERQLMEAIELLDVRPGCVNVRFALDPGTRPEDVSVALKRLHGVRANFDVADAAAHVNGRAVKF